jgi:4-alpha-glucanotransferase
MPLQDVFGWRDRINTPALVSDDNWSWRLPWPVEDLLTEPPAVERAEFLNRLSQETGRT